MTRQEVYDTLIKATLDGTFPSVKPDSFTLDKCRHYSFTLDECRYYYKDEEGKEHRCAVGIFVPSDAPYKPVEDHTYICQSLNFRKWLRERIGLEDGQIKELQSTHDALSRSLNFKRDFIRALNKLSFFANVVKMEEHLEEEMS